MRIEWPPLPEEYWKSFTLREKLSFLFWRLLWITLDPMLRRLARLEKTPPPDGKIWKIWEYVRDLSYSKEMAIALRAVFSEWISMAEALGYEVDAE